MKKIIFSAFLLLCSVFNVQAQGLKQDTLKAGDFYVKATDYLNKSRFDSALTLYRQALPLYKKHKLWEKYFNTANQEVLCLLSLSETGAAEQKAIGFLKESESHFGEKSIQKAVFPISFRNCKLPWTEV